MDAHSLRLLMKQETEHRCAARRRPAHVARDDKGFVPTDRALTPAMPGPVWENLGRAPLPYETSVPGVFAAGDVRAESMKRVAAATGDGADADRSVHQYLALVTRPRAGTCRAHEAPQTLHNAGGCWHGAAEHRPHGDRRRHLTPLCVPDDRSAP
ncbi:hypothetical protein ACVNF4_15765 [Streptomyces sp. S6]